MGTPRDEGKFKLVPVTVQANANIVVTRRILHALETTEPYLFVDSLLVRAQVPPASAITDDDVARYYEANKNLYDTPERVQIWRVLFKTKAEAEQAIVQLKKDASVKAFTELARDKSLDKATAMRAGNLGFVSPDGTSNEAGVKVDPAVVAAARAVKDGELAPQPVPEADAFGVVWRRGTVPANKRPVAEVAPQIRETLYRERMEKATRARIDELGVRDGASLATRAARPRGKTRTARRSGAAAIPTLRS